MTHDRLILNTKIETVILRHGIGSMSNMALADVAGSSQYRQIIRCVISQCQITIPFRNTIAVMPFNLGLLFLVQI